MPPPIPFRQIPQNLRIPLFWAEIDPSQANTNQQNQRSLIFGQSLSDPTKASTVINGTLQTGTSSATLSFVSTPAGVQIGMYALDVTTTSAIAAGTRVIAVGSTTVTLSANATAALNGDTISFFDCSPQAVQSTRQATQLYGAGSVVVDMVDRYRRNDPFGELWVIGVPDALGAVAATGTIVVAGTPTAQGTIPLYIDGISIPVAVTTTMTATQIGDAIVSAIAAATDPTSQNLLPVTAVNASGTVTLTCRQKGALGNDVDVRLAYYGTLMNEFVPPGITVKITAMAGGATNPSAMLTAVLTNLPDTPYDFIAFPWSDATSLNAFRDFLSDVSGRWSWSKQVFGHAFTASKGTFGTLVTLGTSRNDQHTSILGYNDSPSPSWQWAAGYAGACAASGRADPGMPLHGIPLIGIYAPQVQSRFAASDRNALSFDGISTFDVGQDGTVYTGLIITTYQLNPTGQPDNSYLKVETMFLLTAVLRFLRDRITSKFSRVKLADDGTPLPAYGGVVTPNVIKGDQIAAYNDMLALGWVQAGSQFVQTVRVQRNLLNPNRVDVLWAGILVNQLDVVALLAQFRLLPDQSIAA